MKKDFYIRLLEKEAAGELPASEKTDLEKWISTSVENGETARVYRQILKSSEQYSKPVAVDLDARFAELESKLEEPSEAKIRELKPRFNWWRVAATFALLIGGFYTYQNFTQPADLQWVGVEIADGTAEEFTFSDGSKMMLRGGSKIEYPETFLGNERRVKLWGEAFFNVEKNPTQPFIVELENGEVRVLGTSFNVDSKTGEETVSVFVKSGTVRFSATGTDQNPAEVILTKNETGVFSEKENKLEEIIGKNDNEISWITRKLDFENTPLSLVLENISDLYGVDVQFENSDMKNCPIDLSFEKEDLTTVLETVSSVFGMEISKKNEKEILLTGGSCK